MKLKLIFKIIKQLLKAKLYILIISPCDPTKIYPEELIKLTELFYSENTSAEWESNAVKLITLHTVDGIGEQNYVNNLNKYNNELYNAYKEADYQIAKSDYLEAELSYYKLINDPAGGDANRIYMMYQRVLQLKKIYENFN